MIIFGSHLTTLEQVVFFEVTKIEPEIKPPNQVVKLVLIPDTHDIGILLTVMLEKKNILNREREVFALSETCHLFGNKG